MVALKHACSKFHWQKFLNSHPFPTRLPRSANARTCGTRLSNVGPALFLSLARSLSLARALAFSLLFSLSLSLSLHSLSLSLTHTHTLALSLTLTHTHTHSLSLAIPRSAGVGLVDYVPHHLSRAWGLEVGIGHFKSLRPESGPGGRTGVPRS